MTIPVPTGEYAVGTFTYTVQDDRPEALDPSKMRSVASRVYYPIPKDRVKGCTKAKCMSRQMADFSDMKHRLRFASMAGKLPPDVMHENLCSCFLEFFNTYLKGIQREPEIGSNGAITVTKFEAD